MNKEEDNQDSEGEETKEAGTEEMDKEVGTEAEAKGMETRITTIIVAVETTMAGKAKGTPAIMVKILTETTVRRTFSPERTQVHKAQ